MEEHGNTKEEDTMMKPENEMPRDVYVFNSPDSIGDMGFTVTDNREGYIKYTRSPTQPTDKDRADALEVDTRYFRKAPTTALGCFLNLVSAVKAHDNAVVTKASEQTRETYQNMFMCDAMNLARDFSDEITSSLTQKDASGLVEALELCISVMDESGRSAAMKELTDKELGKMWLTVVEKAKQVLNK